jgi:hypothetical protein
MGLYAWIGIVCLITAVIGGRRYLATSLIIFGVFAVVLIAHAQGHLTIS